MCAELEVVTNSGDRHIM